jgi:hypothetical protein
MGAFAEAFVAFAQPLLDQTDGSQEQLGKALAISHVCYNLALFPEDVRAETLREMQTSLRMADEEFEGFLRSVVDPMIHRHREMFPSLHQRVSVASSRSGLSPRALPGEAGTAAPHAGVDRYAPCPCNSGEKYKFCCGRKRR